MLYAYNSEYVALALLLGSIASKIPAVAKTDERINKYADLVSVTALFFMIYFFDSMNDQYFVQLLLVSFVYIFLMVLRLGQGTKTKKDMGLFQTQNSIQIILLVAVLLLLHHPYLER